MPKSVQLNSRSSLPLQILQFCDADLCPCPWVAVFSVTSAKPRRIITVNIFILIIDVGLMPSLQFSIIISIIMVQGWRSGESTCLPPMWPGFDSQIWRDMRVEFVGSLLCTERFSPGTPVSPLLKNHHLTRVVLIVNYC